MAELQVPPKHSKPEEDPFLVKLTASVDSPILGKVSSLDGLLIELYKTFWPLLGPDLLTSSRSYRNQFTISGFIYAFQVFHFIV